MTPANGVVRRLGVFGGAFDPPHLMHRVLVETALEQLRLDRLQVVPTGQAWHKRRPLTDAAHRVAMTHLAFDDLPRVQIDTREIARLGPSYTVDTLRELRGEWPQAELFLIIGQDQAQALPSWHAWEQVVALATICVAGRADPTAAATGFQAPDGLRQRFLQLRLPLSDTSATDIRHRASSGQSIVPLVGEPVARYIVLHRLYQST
ncbi:nicotinate (nicotinamide) nucleotide adenylyltransferase [Comamonadaceae bacterium G21597-S1]|nr:nicotinate (nicotinamide) nucleotide adenylyltransferase [Comamonadaceae bacterium G21597-S1]